MSSSPPTLLLVWHLQRRGMICCLLFDETGRQGNLQLKLIETNTEACLSQPPTTVRISSKTPADTHHFPHISVFRWSGVWTLENSNLQQIHRAWTLILKRKCRSLLIHPSIRSLLLYCRSSSWFVCWPGRLQCSAIMNRDTELCGLIIG